MNDLLTLLVGDCRDMLKTLPDNSVQCCVTSPPYYGLRDYNHAGQIGLEASPWEFLETMVDVFREVRRVLKPDGTCWVNMGDSYAQTGGRGEQGATSQRVGRANVIAQEKQGSTKPPMGFKAKDLMGMPWRLAFALQDDGWWLRQDIIWHKPNPMPESISDRFCKAHEYLFLLTKSPRYYFDAKAVKEPVSGTANPRGSGVNAKAKVPAGWDTTTGDGGHGAIHKTGRNTKAKSKQNASFSAAVKGLVETRTKRSVWTVPSTPYKGSHFATYPPDLIKPCILAGSRPGDTVLDPFGGSGTTGEVALELGRRAILIELNPEYAELIRRRTAVTPGLGF